MEKNLKFLTIDDQALMIESSLRVTFARGAEIIKQGDDSGRALYTISSGVARVEVDGVAIAHLGPGSLIGEMAFLERSPASASVVAHTEVGMDVIGSEHLHTLLASVPGFATRFYASLAALISSRLRTASQLAAGSRSGLHLTHARRLRGGFVRASDCPRELRDALAGSCAQLRELAERAGASASSSSELSASSELSERVATACQRVHDLLTDTVAAYPDQAERIGGHMFRQLFPYLMTSRINQHAFTKPHGYGGDGELLELVCANRESGHGSLGAAVDRWVLDRPIARALRSRASWIARSVGELTADWRGRMPVPVTCLATGTAHDALALLDHERALEVTCLEMDPDALQRAARRYSASAEVRVSFLQANMLALGRGSGHTFLHLQKVIIASDVLNRYGDDSAAIGLLDWIHERLRPDGAVIVGQLHPDHPDRAYLEHILEWHYCYRDERALERLFAASRFKNDSLTIERHADGAQMRAICRRRKSS